MLTRLFGLFGIVLGVAYLNEGVSLTGVVIYAQSQKVHDAFIIQSAFVAWDFLFGLSLIAAGIGLLLLKEWARIMWLGLTPALVLVHLGIIVVSEFTGSGTSVFYWVWTGMIVLVAVLSWRYLTNEKVRARFSRQKQQEN
jgi:hypothetical protein